MNDREIYLNTPEGATSEEISAYIADACGDDEELRRRVEALFAAASEARTDFLVGGGRDGGEPSTFRSDVVGGTAEHEGALGGNYKLLRQIGEGGFGVVYCAQQLKPVSRVVAVKIIKRGMDTEPVVSRFEAERQALALMHHPNIADVYDAGSTESGRPFFVMEFVDGPRITKFCDEVRLDTSERLILFASVCRAVQHAHQKGILHRDIKPSNILVAQQDGKPIVKVIDFGVAKAMLGRVTGQTVSTDLGGVIGTLGYMSPEQAGSEVDADVRSDVYSLGVVLYELLSGSPPFEQERLKNVALDSVLKMIREEDPPTPSTRVSELGEEGAVIAARRASEPGKLARSVRGEMDWIVMKALEKDRGHRYQTPEELALDIERYLNNDSVVAAPPSVFYRPQKFVRRNKIAVFTVMSLLLLALAFSSLAFLIFRAQYIVSLGQYLSGAVEAKSDRIEGVIHRNHENTEQISARLPLKRSVEKFSTTPTEEHREGINAILREARDAVEHCSEMCITDLEGKVIGSSNLESIDVSFAEEWFFLERAEFREQIMRAGGLWSSLNVGDDGVVVVLSKPIVSEGGVKIGILFISMRDDVFAAALESSATMQTMLVGREADGCILVLAPQSKYTGLRYADLQRDNSLYMSEIGETGARRARDNFRGVDVMTANRLCDGFGVDRVRGRQLGVIATIDHSDAFRRLYRVAVTWIILTVVVYIAPAVILLAVLVWPSRFSVWRRGA